MDRLPDQETLNSLLSYDPESGALVWKARPAEMFAPSHGSRARTAAVWNANHAEQAALTGVSSHGYPKGRLLGKDVTAHRIIWKMVHGTEPRCLDHINRVRTDNRLVNLRESTSADNARNRTGVVGATFCSERQKWEARLCINGKNHHLGRFDTKEEAIAARKAAERKMLGAGYAA